jgi:hypothetical protein
LARSKNDLPAPPDFSAATHRAYRRLLAEIESQVKAGDIDALVHDRTEPLSPSRRMICRYRDQAIRVLVRRQLDGATPRRPTPKQSAARARG